MTPSRPEHPAPCSAFTVPCWDYLAIQRGTIPTPILKGCSGPPVYSSSTTSPSGSVVKGIDMYAHLGGLFGGAVLGAVLSRQPGAGSQPDPHNRRSRRWNRYSPLFGHPPPPMRLPERPESEPNRQNRSFFVVLGPVELYSLSDVVSLSHASYRFCLFPHIFSSLGCSSCKILWSMFK